MAQIDEVTPSEARQYLDKGALLLDVREADEWERGRVEGARHIPLGELDFRMSEIPADREIVCMCRSGRRSAKAQTILRALPNSRKIYNLTGGILGWVKDGLPIIGSAEE